MRTAATASHATPRAALPGALVVAACLLTGVFIVLAEPPWDFPLLGWVAPVPWLLVLFRGRRGAVLVGSWLGGAVAVAGTMHWLDRFGVSVWLGLSALQGLGLLVAALLARGLNRGAGWGALLAPAVAWTAAEQLRSVGAYGVPWVLLGETQARLLPAFQAVRWIGVPGLSGLMVLGAGGVLALARGPRRRGAIVIAATAVVVLGAQWHSLQYARGARGFRVAVVQPSVEVDLPPSAVNAVYDPAVEARWLATLRELSLRARGAQLIVWPESAFDRPLQTPEIATRVAALAREADACLAVNTPRIGPEGDFNTTTIVTPDGGMTEIYDKVRLVPFGEYIPFGLRPLIAGRYTIRSDDAAAGTRWHALDACGTRVGAAVCFESAFPEAARALRRDGARVLVVQTNDAWLGFTAGPEQHARIALARAVETGCWLLRSASGGVSLIANPRGRIETRAALGERTTLTDTVSAAPGATPYSAGGWLVPWLCLVGSVVLALFRGAHGEAKG